MAHLKNRHNEYAAELGDMFDEMPKAVLAAIAVSALTCGGDILDKAALLAAVEWATLHGQGIVPQAPGKLARAVMRKGEV
jgi:hypothetical protein